MGQSFKVLCCVVDGQNYVLMWSKMLVSNALLLLFAHLLMLKPLKKSMY